jgi:hypothetical protein
MAEPRFPDRLRLPLAFDPGRLAADMAAVAAAGWTEHFVKQNYDGDWSVIALRGPSGAKHPVQMIYSDPGCTDFADTPALAAEPYFQDVLAALACPLQAVRLMRLAPGSTIKEHRDHDLAFEDGTVRVHIPVTTNDGVDFRLNGVRCVMAAGSAWYLRLADPHSVANQGHADRVHMVIDAVVDGWVAALFDRAAGGRRPGGLRRSRRVAAGAGRSYMGKERGMAFFGLRIDSSVQFCYSRPTQKAPECGAFDPNPSGHQRRSKRASSGSRQQRRSSPEGAEEEDAARGHFPRDEASRSLRKAVGKEGSGEGGSDPSRP